MGPSCRRQTAEDIGIYKLTGGYRKGAAIWPWHVYTSRRKRSSASSKPAGAKRSRLRSCTNNSSESHSAMSGKAFAGLIPNLSTNHGTDTPSIIRNRVNRRSAMTCRNSGRSRAATAWPASVVSRMYPVGKRSFCQRSPKGSSGRRW